MPVVVILWGEPLVAILRTVFPAFPVVKVCKGNLVPTNPPNRVVPAASMLRFRAVVIESESIVEAKEIFPLLAVSVVSAANFTASP